MTKANAIRAFMLFEAATFIVASSIHAGLLVAGYGHHAAHVAETVIACVLLASVAATWIQPRWTRGAGLAGQGFALLATLVGIATIIIGIGPRTVPDIIYHICIVIVLVWGLVFAVRARADELVARP